MKFLILNFAFALILLRRSWQFFFCIFENNECGNFHSIEVDGHPGGTIESVSELVDEELTDGLYGDNASFLKDTVTERVSNNTEVQGVTEIVLCIGEDQ